MRGRGFKVEVKSNLKYGLPLFPRSWQPPSEGREEVYLCPYPQRSPTLTLHIPAPSPHHWQRTDKCCLGCRDRCECGLNVFDWILLNAGCCGGERKGMQCNCPPLAHPVGVMVGEHGKLDCG